MRVIHQGDKLAVAAHRLKRTSISDLSRILTTVFSSTDNQEYYVDLLDDMSFSSFVYPENWEEVLYEVCRALGGGR